MGCSRRRLRMHRIVSASSDRWIPIGDPNCSRQLVPSNSARAALVHSAISPLQGQVDWTKGCIAVTDAAEKIGNRPVSAAFAGSSPDGTVLHAG